MVSQRLRAEAKQDNSNVPIKFSTTSFFFHNIIGQSLLEATLPISFLLKLIPLLRNFYVRTYVNFYTQVDEIEAIYGRSPVNAIVEPRSTFTFTRG